MPSQNWARLVRGTVTPLHTSRYWTLALLVVVVLAAWEIMVLSTLSYSRRALARGHIVSYNLTTQVVAPMAGVIEEIEDVNTRVTSGARLVSLLSSDVNTQGHDSTTANLAKKINSISHSTQDIQRETEVATQTQRRSLAALDHEAGLLRAANSERVLRAEVIAKRLSSLEASIGSFSQADIDAVRLELLNEREALARGGAELTRLEQRRQSTVENHTQRMAELNLRKRNLELLEIDVQMSRDDRKRSSTSVVTSPSEGVVSSVLVSRGQSVSQGQLLAVIESRSKQVNEYRVQVRLKPSSVGSITKGTPIFVEVDSFPAREYGLFKGFVTSMIYLPANEAGVEATFLVEATIENRLLKQFGRPVELTNGMSVSAEVVTDRLTLLQWLLEPVLVNLQRQKM